MTTKLRMRKFGDGHGVSLPKAFGFEEGDAFLVIWTSEGPQLTRLDLDFKEAKTGVGDFIQRYCNLTKALAEN